MSILSKLIGGGVGEMAKGVANAIDTFVETEEERKAADILLQKTQQEPDKWQAVTNQIEAAHRSIFVAGWRPFLGWVCGIGIAWHFIGLPFASFILAALGKQILVSALPVVSASELLTLVFGMLGLGAARTYEKKNGLTK
jgi:hypothetical protein